ncbi:MAG: DNA-directed RNA polymerase subunit B'' [Candidatus ainarchaeum sp.]|nr:DNA-directed RNA polymerase subunit B'' [Candidatus ainarchaeum sp.]MDD3975955.1 DNA-directed RNA polymerase subunit B'' [Candidatus ainarchaeum sp.]
MDKWALIESYYKQYGPIYQRIKSFDQFIDEKIPEIIQEYSEIECNNNVLIKLSNVEITRPEINEADRSARVRLTPMEARQRNMTYAGSIYLDIELFRKNVKIDEKRVYVGDIPIIVKSKYCNLHGLSNQDLIDFGEDPMDFGGYFVVNGSEKSLITQEVLALDRILLGETDLGVIKAQVISVKGAFKGKVKIERNTEGLLYVTFPSSPRKLALVELINALGIEKENKIIELFSDEKIIRNEILLNLDKIECTSNQEALDKIGKAVAPSQTQTYRLRRAQEVIDSFLLPHIGQDKKDRTAKAYYLITMATKIIEKAYNLRPDADKDHYSNKRLELSGKLMENLFRYSFKHFINDLKFQIDRTISRHRKLNITTVIRPNAITDRINFAVSTGTWIGQITGVCAFLDRVNYVAPLTNMRKVKSTLDSQRELYEARDVHGTHWGRLCPIETPDGPNCGLSKNLSLMARVTTDVSNEVVLKNIDVEEINI